MISVVILLGCRVSYQPFADRPSEWICRNGRSGRQKRRLALGQNYGTTPVAGKRPLRAVLTLHMSFRDLTTINAVPYTGEGNLVRKATGYEQKKLKPRSPTSGSRAARTELPAAIRAYQGSQFPLKRQNFFARLGQFDSI